MSVIADKRVLVLEDEYLIALHLADLLEELGARVVGPAHRISQAVRLVEAEDIDAAVLDVNINGAESHDVAGLLSFHRIPYVFATGYGEQKGLDGATVIRKPYSLPEVRRALEAALDP